MSRATRSCSIAGATVRWATRSPEVCFGKTAMTPPPSAELKAVQADDVVRVRGGGAQVFALAKGDRLRAIDIEGGQSAMFYAFDADGRDGAALLGLGSGHAGGLPDLL